jgi:hypothetical protein
MPSALISGDRKIVLVAGAILLALVVATAALAPSSNDEEGEGVPSTYSTAKNGAQAAYLLLGKLGYRSERWEKPPTELPSDAEGKILIFADPANVPTMTERQALLQFAGSGGWIIYAGDSPFPFLETGGVTPPTLTQPSFFPEKFPAVAPSPFTRSAPEITMFASNRWIASDGTQVPLYGEPEEPVVVTWRLGHGRIFWWAAPTPVTNVGISRAGNLGFLLDCIAAIRPGAAADRTTVLWDEYFHGYQGSMWNYFEETPVRWAILQLALVAGFVFLTFGRRSGPLYVPITASRLSPLEFVDTMGDLYARAKAGPAAVRVAYQRFRGQLTRRLVLAPSVSNMQLDAAVRERLGWKQPGLFDALQRAEKAAQSNELSSAGALSIVQALEHYEVLFGQKRHIQEKP